MPERFLNSYASEVVKSTDRDTSVDWFVSMSLGELVRSLWRCRLSIAFWSIALTGLLTVVVFLLPTRYDSDAQLLVRLGRNTLSVDPTSHVTPSVSVQETRLAQVNSVAEMLRSRALTEQIVERVGADRILEPHGVVEETIENVSKWLTMRLERALRRNEPAGWQASAAGSDRDSHQLIVDSSRLSPQEAEQQLRKEEALAKLEDNIDITIGKNAYTIHVRVRSSSPYLSRELLTALIELYQQHHVAAYHSEATLPFFEQQTSQAYDAAVAAKEKVRSAKNSMHVIEIEAARMALREQLTQARRELDQVAIDLAATMSEVQRYELEMKALPERVQAETVTGITSNKSDGMRQQLYALEVQVKELGSKLREDHPQMKAVRDQLEAATVIAEQERKEQPQSREAINPVYQQLELAYRNSLVRRDGLQAKRDSLTKHLKELDQDIVELNRQELELTKLNWEASLAENVYLENAQNRDRARLIEALDREGLSEISVVQPASLRLKKSSPRRSLLLVATAFLAVGIAFFQAIVRTVVSAGQASDTGRRQRPNLASEEFDLTSPTPRQPAEKANNVASETEESDYALQIR